MGGKLIKDHSSWVGGMTEDSVLPKGSKSKHESSAEGAGSLNKYEDTTEAIKSQQEMGKGKINSHSPRSEYRN